MKINNNMEFIGNKREILVENKDEVNLDIIYSSWKNWVIKDMNAKYPPAFKVENNKLLLINDWEIKS